MDDINTEQYIKSIQSSAIGEGSVENMPDSQTTKASCNLQRKKAQLLCLEMAKNVGKTLVKNDISNIQSVKEDQCKKLF